MRRLIEGSHEPRHRQLRHALRAIAIGKALIAAGIVERLDEPDETGRRYRLTMDLQLDFALDQPLSPLALAALDILDQQADTYALDAISLIEATLEGPRPVLSAQRFKARGEAVAAMKADGIEYEDRMALLEDVDYPKPLADLIEVAYEAYRKGAPWIAEFQPEPKSVIRDMYERAMTFSEYVAFYALTRSEGVVLRYFADAYRALRRTVPTSARTEDLTDITSWLGELVRGVDSSLLDEWEALAHPEPDELGDRDRHRGPAADRRPRRHGQRARPSPSWSATRCSVGSSWSRCDHYAELGELHGGQGWRADTWADAMDDYWDEYRRPRDRCRGPRRRPDDDHQVGRHLDRAADLRRPGRRSGLGDQRRRRPRCLRRSRRAGPDDHRRRTADRLTPARSGWRCLTFPQREGAGLSACRTWSPSVSSPGCPT